MSGWYSYSSFAVRDGLLELVYGHRGRVVADLKLECFGSSLQDLEQAVIRVLHWCGFSIPSDIDVFGIVQAFGHVEFDGVGPVGRCGDGLQCIRQFT